jgi:hypothetical protein
VPSSAKTRAVWAAAELRPAHGGAARVRAPQAWGPQGPVPGWAVLTMRGGRRVRAPGRAAPGLCAGLAGEVPRGNGTG